MLGYILLIIAVVAAIIFWKKSKAPLTTIAPKQCLFQVDDKWSTSFQKAVISFVQHRYQKDKNPEKVIDAMTEQFPEIGAIQAQVCSKDKICFHIEGIQPIFLLNNSQVVGATGCVSNKKDFCSEILTALPIISSQTTDELLEMIQFTQCLSPETLALYTITWHNKDYIILSHRDGCAGMQCITCTRNACNHFLVHQCYELYQEQQALQPKKKMKKKLIYDIRFKNQIIVRPGG